MGFDEINPTATMQPLVIICNTGLYSELINLYKLGSALSELNNKNII